MISWLRLLLVLLAFAPLAAQADNGLQWRCWYNQQVHITCLLENLAGDGKLSPDVQLPRNLPPIVKQMRDDPAAFRNRFVQIPLHSIPYEMEFTAMLAKATVCGSRRDCAVTFTPIPPPPSEILALLNRNQPGTERDDRMLLAMVAGLEAED